MNKIIEQINQHLEIFKMIKDDKSILNNINLAAEMIKNSMNKGNKIMICGNGGSAADSQHMAAEFIGRFAFDSHPLPAIALTTDTSILTCVSNDYIFDDIFVRQIDALGKPGDVLLSISTSGSSKNILKAIEFSRKNNIKTILLSSHKLFQFNDIDCLIQVPSKITARVQEAHLFIEHYLCGYVEEALCSDIMKNHNE